MSCNLLIQVFDESFYSVRLFIFKLKRQNKMDFDENFVVP